MASYIRDIIPHKHVKICFLYPCYPVYQKKSATEAYLHDLLRTYVQI